MNNEYDSTSTPETGNFGLGRLTKVTDQSGSTAFQYDRLGNNIKKIRAVTGVAGTFATSSEYNALSRETRPNITDSVGAMSQNFIYDELSRLKLAVSAATYGSKYYEYDRTGNMIYNPDAQASGSSYYLDGSLSNATISGATWANGTLGDAPN